LWYGIGTRSERGILDVMPFATPNRLSKIFAVHKPIIGVIHLLPLPGFAGSPGLSGVIEKARADQHALETGGVDGVLVENEEDHPHEVEAGPATIANMTLVVAALVSSSHRPLGVEILLNDPKASLAVAAATGARYIRTDYFVDRMDRAEYGEMKIDPAGVIAYGRRLAGDILVFTDIQVKYARMLEPRTLAESAALACEHGADAVVVTGTMTGRAPGPIEIHDVQRGAGGCPVLVGSGLDISNATSLLALADGAIVGTFFKTGDCVDTGKVRALVRVARSLRTTVA
jgi:membrane complex biogenesis BtpA family protein